MTRKMTSLKIGETSGRACSYEVLPDELKYLFLSLEDPNNLMIAFLLAVGFTLKHTPALSNNEWIPLIITVIGAAVCPVFIKPIEAGVVRGVIYAVVSIGMYELVIRRFEAWISTVVAKLLPESSEKPPGASEEDKKDKKEKS